MAQPIVNVKVPERADVVVIGGGVMGASTAYHLAKAGAGSVVLLERDTYFGQEATGRCAGGVRYQFATEVNIRLSMASLPMLEHLEEETGQECNYRKCGYLFVLTRPEDVRGFERHAPFQRAPGVRAGGLEAGGVPPRLPLMGFEDALAGTSHALD